MCSLSSRYGQYWTPSEYTTAALALDAQDGRSGSITCLRGSHRLPVLPHRRSGVLGASLALTQSPANLPDFQEVSLQVRRTFKGASPPSRSRCALRPRGWLCLAASAWRRVFSPHQPDPQNRPQHYRIFPPQSRLWVPFAARTPSCPFSSPSVARRCRETLTGRSTKPRSRAELRAADVKLHRPHTFEGCARAPVVAIVNHVFLCLCCG